jgi:hypothetical protein
VDIIILLINQMQIFIRGCDKTRTLDVKSTDTILDIKKNFQHITKIPYYMQQLTYRSKFLDNHLRLKDYEIESECTLYFSITNYDNINELIKIIK